MSNRAQSVSESVWLKIIARLSMASLFPILAITSWLAIDWLDKRFDGVSIPLKKVEIRVDALEARERPNDMQLQNHDLRLGATEKAVGNYIKEMDELTVVVNRVNTSLQGLIQVLEDRDKRVGAKQ